jgi:NAD(P)-dependent dehydrogenase (short-subunit alcohol dehydrogenase family)
MKDFKGKVAVITGAASGIGFGLAERCAKEGMKVVLADIEKGALAKAEKDIKTLGAETLAVRTDVSQASDVEALAKKTLDTFGAVHLLFNNAGVGAGALIWTSKLHDWQWVLGVNLWGVIHGVNYFMPIMFKQGFECHIVNTASSAGLMAASGNSPYTVSKHAVVALTEILYRDLALIGNKNIGVSVLCPGFIKTNILTCERNRPAALKNKPGEGLDLTDPVLQSYMKQFIQMFENGMPVAKSIDIIFAAIKDNKFYILPNAEMYKPIIQSRMQDIIQECNPTPFPTSS